MNAAILNAGGGAWAFEEQARRLARAMNIQVRPLPADFNYILAWDGADPPDGKSFIPYESILVASDKRRLAEVFAADRVAAPRTYLLDSLAEVRQLIRAEARSEWVLKWPTGCGGFGHRLLGDDTPVPRDWPRPYILQEFIRLETPEVYRLYAVAGKTFGWNVRRFPPGSKSSPFVAHARGARYENAGELPGEAEYQARQALSAAGLLSSFGCADLMRDPRGRWLVLEVNTDGLFSIVDREFDEADFAVGINQRLARAFQDWAGPKRE